MPQLLLPQVRNFQASQRLLCTPETLPTSPIFPTPVFVKLVFVNSPIKMPFAAKPSCTDCKTSSSNIWRKNPSGEVVCNSCHLKKPGTREGSEEPGSSKTRSGREGHGGFTAGSQYIGPIRKSARLKPSKYKYQASFKPLATKGKSRRVVFKKNVRMILISFLDFVSILSF